MGQIEIWDYHDWYLRGGHFDADRVFGQWVEREDRALDFGYKGLRITGDVAWLEKGDWPDFMAYEAEVNRVLRQHRMIALCLGGHFKTGHMWPPQNRPQYKRSGQGFLLF
jgi:DcmR-like sensory protein